MTEVIITKPNPTDSIYRSSSNDRAFEKKKSIYRSYQMVWYLFSIVEFLLGFRFLLRFLGANPANPFANMVLSLSYPFAYPFFNLFGNTSFGGSVVEWSTLIAMAVYWMLAYGLVNALQMAKPISREEIAKTIDNPSV